MWVAATVLKTAIFFTFSSSHQDLAGKFCSYLLMVCKNLDMNDYF